MEPNERSLKLVCRHYESPCGRLVLGSLGDKLCMCDWDIDDRLTKTIERLCKEFWAEATFGESETTESAARQLDEYFAGRRKRFSMPLIFKGSPLQHTVWEKLQSVNYGETVSYSDIAERTGRPSAVRAVASAIGRNPMSIFIPCHRITGKSGSIGGYAGGVEAKRRLLALESLSPEISRNFAP